jgi:hypothetical protein
LLLERGLTEQDERQLCMRLRRQAAVEEVDYRATCRSGTSLAPAISGTARFPICAPIDRK